MSPKPKTTSRLGPRSRRSLPTTSTRRPFRRLGPIDHTNRTDSMCHHHVLLFGSAANVWAYNRVGARLPEPLPASRAHVDDYASIGPATSAQSGFGTFEQPNSLLGFHMKTSKRQPPEPSHRIQGVIVSCDQIHMTVSPCLDRIQHITKQVRQHLATKQMTPEQARKLAGACSFTTTPTLRQSRMICTKSPLRQIMLQHRHSFYQHTHRERNLGGKTAIQKLSHDSETPIQKRRFRN